MNMKQIQSALYNRKPLNVHLSTWIVKYWYVHMSSQETTSHQVHERLSACSCFDDLLKNHGHFHYSKYIKLLRKAFKMSPHLYLWSAFDLNVEVFRSIKESLCRCFIIDAYICDIRKRFFWRDLFPTCIMELC